MRRTGRGSLRGLAGAFRPLAWVLGAAIVLAGWRGFAADKPEASLAADLSAAQKLLEQGKYAEFMERFAPAEELRRIRQADAMDQAAKAISQRPEAAKKLVELLKDLKARKPTFDSSGGYATFEIETGGAANPEPPPTPPVAKKVAVFAMEGYDGELGEVVAAALKSLEAGEDGTFADKLLPVSAALKLQEEDARAAYLARLKQLPAVRKRMVDDLKAIAELKPEMSEEGKVATFTLSGEDVPDRTIRFEKNRTSWRLADGSEKVTASIDAASQVKLVAPRSRTRVEFEKLGGGWRFVQMKL